MSKKKSTPVLNLLGSVLKHEAKKVDMGWPPACMGILYQPKRPVKKQD